MVRERLFGFWIRCDAWSATGLTAEDILNVSPKYLEFHTDPILIMDSSVPILLTIHCNLYTGTLAMFAPGRPDVQTALDRALRFEIL